MLLRKYTGREATDNGWIIHGDFADVKLVFMTEDVIRVRVSFNREFPESSYALITTAWEDQLDALFQGERTRVKPLTIHCTETDGFLQWRTNTLELRLRKEPFAFTLLDGNTGEVLYRDLQERAFEQDQLGRVAHYSVIDRKKDHFYGFGEKTGQLDKKGRRLRETAKDAIGHDPEFGDPMYKHIPFYIRIHEEKKHPLGLFYHNSHDCVFDMGQEISGYWEPYCYYQADGGDIDLFLIHGNTVKSVVQRYTWLTGRTMLPTKQSLGYCASTMYYTELDRDCDEEIYRVVEKHRREGIPLDNFWLASGYSSGEEDNLRYTFHWNRRRFPNPKKFFEQMEERGINVICNLKPGVLAHHPYAKFYEERDAYIKTPDGKKPYIGRWWGGAGRFVDFTSPRGRAAWKELLKEHVLALGEKTVWNDNCEMDGVEDRAAYCDNEGIGGTMAELKIIHSNMMAKLGKETLEEVWEDERPYVINRAGFAGIQRYAQVWGGDNLTDWRTPKFNIATVVGMGLSGCANMGCDIGGFTGPAPTAELFLRWLQSAVFQPRFVINSANTDNTVTQPWMYPDILQDVREAFRLRYRMLPYLYSLLYEANQTGAPVMRPLFYEFPEDTRTYTDAHFSFLVGSSLLVAPVVEKGTTQRQIYLPEGAAWYDLGDHWKRYEGGQEISISVGQGSIPMFLRSGGILSMTDDIHHILTDKMYTLKLLIGAEEDADFLFYDDDGHTQAYKRDVSSRWHITMQSGPQIRIHVQIDGSYDCPIEQLNLCIASPEKGAYWVSVDGNRLQGFLVREEFEAAESGWFYAMENRTILVKLQRPEAKNFSVVVSRESFDLVGMGSETDA